DDGEGFWREVSNLQLLLAPVGSTADILAAGMGLGGPVTTISTACSSATNAIGQAMRWIRSGRCTRVIAGGADSLTRLTHAGFNSLSLVDRERPLPFDARRDGMVIGEGAAFFVLEDEARARARGAQLHGRVLGYGAIAEAHHLVQPRGDGDGAARAMGLALADAGVETDRVDYINAHGTATPHNDAAEGRGIVSVLGRRSQAVPVSSTKSQVGHLLGASGAVELAACVVAMNEGFL
ncbi:MAG TPA: beta-ketoacyl-[acyl-carrier-protein] synthase family protein, partial [Deltaproteobacteria bacterium]|nr:beta-ketoacyl-[acyl-carrier-protein] synthase family protein [Deltaproteobacteria bacterium]